MGIERWRQVRDLFDAISELPREQWPQALAEQCDDASIREEVLQLLRSQTVGLSRVSNRLDTALARAMAPELGVGERLGPWRLTERIAQGGMGTVFKAERADGLYQRTVAIKLLHGMPGAAEVELLSAERQVLADLQLPHVARLYDGGTTPDGHPYLVMEYIDGRRLDGWCEEKGLGLVQRLDLFLRTCAIVQSAHERLVLHCDLKPSNVLVLANGQPVLLDFGLAQLLNEARDRSDSGFCTPAYASPELIRGQTVGVASDVYSLGVILAELLSTRTCTRESLDADLTVTAPSRSAPPDLQWRRRLAGDLDAIVMRACALDTGNRYRSVEALSADIRRYLERKPVLARDGGRLYRLGKGLRRNWQAALLVSGAAVVLAIFLVGLLETRRQAREEADIARQVSNFMVGIFETADPFLRTERGQEDLSSRQLLDKASLQVANDLRDAPMQRARMQAVLGAAYQNLGVAQQAERLLQQAHDGFMRPDVRRPGDAAAVLANLSRLKTAEGDGARGEAMAERGLALLGTAHAPEVAAKLHAARALALTNQQHYDEAERAFDVARNLYGTLPQSDGGAAMHELIYNKGMMYMRWGRREDAERTYRQVLGSLHGRRTAMALAVEMRLAQMLTEQGAYAQALPLLQAGMQHAVAFYGADNSFVLLQHDALADLYQGMGNYAAADAEFRARQALSATIDGVESVSYSMGLYNYGTLYEARGDIAKAEQLFRQAWDIRRTQLGADAPVAMRAEVGLGRILMREGRMEEARPLLMHADAGMSAMLPVDAPGRQEARWVRASWHVRNNELDEAERLLAGESTRLSNEGQQLLLSLRGDLAQRRGQESDALALRRNVLALARSVHGDENTVTALRRIELAETLLQFGYADMAQEELRVAGPVLQRLQLETSPDRRKVEGLMLLARKARSATAG